MIMADEQGTDMVVGKEDGRAWMIVPISDSRSDNMRPSLIVGPEGLRYPEDHEIFTDLIMKGN